MKPANEGAPERRRWRHLHHSAVFWVSVVFIMLAMTIYVVSGNLSFWPARAQQLPQSAIAP